MSGGSGSGSGSGSGGGRPAGGGGGRPVGGGRPASGSGSGSGSGGGGPVGGSGSGSGGGAGGGGGGGLGPLQLGPDGVVRGGSGSEQIFPNFRDGDGDKVDGSDARLSGEVGNDDIIYANGGNDTVNASDGDDYVDAGRGNDIVHGGVGHDVVAGNAGNDTLYGEAGNDTLFGGGGNDSISGGDGHDTIYGDNNSGATGNLIQNGDFSTGATGWRLIDGNGDGVAPHIQTDAQFNQASKAAGDAIEQTFNTNIGAEHTVSLDLFENHSGAAHHVFRIDVIDADGKVISSETAGAVNDSSQRVSFTFTATTANTTLRITNPSIVGDGNSSDGRIDNISVVETPDVAGNDTIDAGSGNDVVHSGDGQDTIFGNDGSDTITAGRGNDTVDGGRSTDHMDGGDGIDTVSYQRSFSGANETVDLDLQQGVGRLSDGTTETVRNFENAIGGQGNDTLAGTSGDNQLEGGDGSDKLYGRDGDDTLKGGSGNDQLFGGQNSDTLDGGLGNDTLKGEDGTDTLVRSAGNDVVDGGSGRDTYDSTPADGTFIHAVIDDSGNGFVDKFASGDRDTITSVEHYRAGESANDDQITLTTNVTDVATVTGLNDSTAGTFTSNSGQVIQFGGAGQPKLRDILDGNVQGVTPGGSYRIISGDESGQIGNVSFENFEKINFTVVCFAAGTRISTPEGERLIDDLAKGDKVLTQDNGAQDIRWIGTRHLSEQELRNNPHLRPIRIRAGALGPDLPKRDLLVSPQHRILVSAKLAERMFGSAELLIAAKKLIAFDGIEVVEHCPEGVSYYHFLCSNHELVWSEGTLTETLFTGQEALKSLPPASRDEIFAIFPELKTGNAMGIPQIARPVPSGAKLRNFLERMQTNERALSSNSPAAPSVLPQEKRLS